ncbi:hypothetical protein ACIBEJ_23295 [Nonomuraea sp. NPDC050790]|uniref:hypothetical protein n=1 Tax=Nonomuraea sp. NPDC050790 TaxID=3364371 RepID=UPI00378CB1D0
MRVHLLVPAAALLAVSSGVPMGGADAGVMTYACETKATGQIQEIRVNVELTVPPTAKVGEQLTIGWLGSYAGGGELIAPSAELKLYAYAGISKIKSLTSATGVATLPSVTAGQPIVLPQTVVELKTTPREPGSGFVRPAAINFGPTATDPVIECEVGDRGTGSVYPLTVEGTTSTESERPTEDEQPTGTGQPEETGSPREPENDEPVDEVKTPIGGADTGGGGDAGPDGRIVALAGLVVLAGAGAGLARVAAGRR